MAPAAAVHAPRKPNAAGVAALPGSITKSAQRSIAHSQHLHFLLTPTIWRVFNNLHWVESGPPGAGQGHGGHDAPVCVLFRGRLPAEATPVQSSGAFTRADHGGYHPALGHGINGLRQASSGESAIGHHSVS